MNALTTYAFHDIDIRTQRDEAGEPLFCLADVCKVLELANPTHTANAIKEEFGIPTLNVGVIQRETGPVDATFITEPQLYFVMMRSRSANARPFRQWIANEVLPAIRKTGAYVSPKAAPKSNPDFDSLLKGAVVIFQAAGLEGNQLALALDKVAVSETGKSMLQGAGLQLAAPTQERLVTPTELGKPLGLSARKVNLILEKIGFQRKTDTGWELTEKGKAAGGVYLDTGKRHSNGTPIRQIKWSATSATTAIQAAL